MRKALGTLVVMCTLLGAGQASPCLEAPSCCDEDAADRSPGPGQDDACPTCDCACCPGVRAFLPAAPAPVSDPSAATAPTGTLAHVAVPLPPARDILHVPRKAAVAA